MLATKKPKADSTGWGALAVVLWLLVAGCTPPGARALLQGEKHLRAGDFSRAIERLKAATQLLPRNAQAWNFLGLAYHGAKQTTNAVIAYHRALALDRDLMAVHYNLGCLWLEQNDPNTAIEELNSYVTHPQHAGKAEGWAKLGVALIRAQRWEDAHKVFDYLVNTLGAKSPEYDNNLGITEVRRNQLAAAVGHFNTALTRQPNYAPALLNLATLYHQQPQSQPLALQKYREYLALDPPPPDQDVVADIARRLDERLNTPQLRPVVRHSVAPPGTPPENPPAPKTETAAAPSTPKPTESQTAAAPDQASAPEEISPPPAPPAPPARPATPPETTSSPPSARVAKAAEPPKPEPPTAPSTPSPKQDTPKATEAPNELAIRPMSRPKPAAEPPAPRPAEPPAPRPTAPVATSTRPASGSPSAPTTASTSKLVPPPSARRYQYISPVRPLPGNHEAALPHFRQGLERQRARQLAQARASYRKALQLDPAYFEAEYNLALVAYAQKDWKQALAALETALALEPDSVNARYQLAATLRQAGYPYDAIDQLQTILQSNPDVVRAQLTLAIIYAQQLDEPGRAREHYRKVLELAPQHPQAAAIRFWLAAHP